jgi:hypothetical protein
MEIDPRPQATESVADVAEKEGGLPLLLLLPAPCESHPVVFLDASGPKRDGDGKQTREKKKKRAVAGKRQVVCLVGGMYGSSAPRERRPVALPASQRPRMTHAKIDAFLQRRSETVGAVTQGLFSSQDHAVLNELGDVRHQGCTLNAPLGPFPAGKTVEIIDWLPSFSAVLLSETGKISDTIALAMGPATVGDGPSLLPVA